MTHLFCPAAITIKGTGPVSRRLASLREGGRTANVSRYRDWGAGLEINTLGMESRIALLKLDGVGPVDNRPSTNKLHNLKKKEKNVTCDT